MPIDSEAKKILPQAIQTIGDLIVGDQLCRLLGNDPITKRKNFWEDAQQKYYPFSEIISGTRTALIAAYTTHAKNQPSMEVVMGLHFRQIQDTAVQDLLTNLLVARTIKRPGYYDYELNVATEARAMQNELGEFPNLSLDQVVESILTGGLKFARQTQLG